MNLRFYKLSKTTFIFLHRKRKCLILISKYTYNFINLCYGIIKVKTYSNSIASLHANNPAFYKLIKHFIICFNIKDSTMFLSTNYNFI